MRKTASHSSVHVLIQFTLLPYHTRWRTSEQYRTVIKTHLVKKKVLTRCVLFCILVKVDVKKKYFTRGRVHGKNRKAGFII